MFHITLSPQRGEAALAVSAEGAALVLNGTAVDLAVYDAEAAPSPWIVGQPRLAEGVWQVALILPHGGDAPPETLFPAPVTVAADGPVALPPYDAGPGESAG